LFLNENCYYEICDDETFTNEYLECLTIKIFDKKGFIKLVTIYRPPNSDIKSFFNDFEKLLTNCNLPTYITGDFNIDMNLHSSTKLQFENIFYSYNFTSLITFSTRISSTSSSLIDNILTNVFEKHKNGVIISDFSDHYFIFSLTSKTLPENKTKSTFYTRNLSTKTISIVKKELNNVSWEAVYNADDVNISWAKFFNIFINIVNNNAPLKLCPKSNIKHCWVNSDILKLSRIKNKLFTKLVHSPTSSNLYKYKFFRNSFTKLKRKTEKQFYENKFENSVNDIKMKWRIINETLNNSKPSTNINQIKINNIILEDKTDITNALNNNFISTVEALQNNLNCNNNDNNNHDNNIIIKKVIIMIVFTIMMIILILLI